MTLGYLLGGGVGAVPQGTELYGAFPDVRRTYEEVAGLTGVPVERMLTGELPPANSVYRGSSTTSSS